MVEEIYKSDPIEVMESRELSLDFNLLFDVVVQGQR